jgi:hypothetical protein
MRAHNIDTDGAFVEPFFCGGLEVSVMTKLLRGVVKGRTIELEGDTGLEDGRKVEVIVKAKELPGPPPGWRPGSSETAAGTMASLWTDEDDRILEEIYKDRRKDSRREVGE